MVAAPFDFHRSRPSLADALTLDKPWMTPHYFRGLREGKISLPFWWRLALLLNSLSVSWLGLLAIALTKLKTRKWFD